mmetsp:Transcript_8116/g.22814  ORF Transcript_8116/g.22814 Transcript_8116/m.22814 type:complete len:90 (+) Transcript_8116:124-393(+)
MGSGMMRMQTWYGPMPWGAPAPHARQSRSILPSDASQIGQKCLCNAVSTVRLITLDEPQLYTLTPPGPHALVRATGGAYPVASMIVADL